MKITAYLRVSMDKQDTDNQRHGVTAYAVARNLQPLVFVEDTASGTKDWRKRKLGEMLEKAAPGEIFLFSEVSRIGRNTLQTLEFLKEAAEKNIAVHVAKQNLILDNSLGSKIIATTLALAAEIEREFISMRTKEGLARRVAEGVKLGRPKGSTSTNPQLLAAIADIQRMRKAKVSAAAIARTHGVARDTVRKFLKEKGI